MKRISPLVGPSQFGWTCQTILTRYLLAVSILGFLAGCDTSSSRSANDSATTDIQLQPASESASQTIEGPDALTLLGNLTTRYSLAKSYQDKGVLQLSYQLQGRAIVEPHPFSTSWEGQNLLSCRLFQAQLQSDGKRLSCYVFDIDTANLDEQQLLLPVEGKLPIDQLFEDAIVRHYLGGYADLPLDESDKTRPPKLIPPPISLLTRQMPFGWINSPTAAKRLPDQTVEGKPCFLVRSQFNEMTADIWIDQSSKLLRQISMPLKIMDRDVLTAGEIKDVELMMKFQGAQIDAPIQSAQPSAFEVALKPKATPVRRFLSVPDPFPSERIGQMVPKFELLRPNGDRIDHLHFDGKIGVLAWIDGADLDTLSKTLPSLIAKHAGDDVEFGLVYSDADLKQPGSSSLEPNAEIATLARSLKVPMLFDRQLQTSTKFQLRVRPAVAVINADARLEFVGSLGKEKWDQELSVVIEKVQRGADVAGEMETAYQEFQANYQKQRIDASARNLLNPSEIKSVAIVDPQPTASNLAGQPWKPVIVWSNKQFTQPGNVVINQHRSPPSLLILDGWRSVVELDLDGSEIGRYKLELPEQSAVSCLRLAPSSEGNARFAAFNVQSESIFLFDKDWKLVSTLPPSHFEHDGIRDAVFLSRSQKEPGAKGLLLVALANDGGCVEFDNESRVMKQVFRSRADSIVRIFDQVYFANPTNWGLLQDESEQTSKDEDLMYQKLFAVESASKQENSFVGITSVDRDNNWYFGRLGSDGKLAWRQPIGAQLFENEIESLSGCNFAIDQTDGSSRAISTIIAIADSGNRVTVVSEDGTFLGQFAAPAPLSGIAMLQYQGSLHLILSTKEGVANYRLSSGGVSAMPVSNKK